MNVTAKFGRTHIHLQSSAEKFHEPVDAVIRSLVASVDQWVMTIDLLDAAVCFAQRREMRIVLPKFRTGTAHVGHEFPRMAAVQVAHRCCEHHEVAGG